MNVGIIGSGDVAKTLAGGFLKYGHKVMMGSRSPEKLAGWLKENSAATTGSFADAAAFGEVVVLAVKGTASAEALRQAGAANLSGKTIIDVSNPTEEKPPVDGVFSFFTDVNYSLMEQLQAEFPDAKFVKAFNSVGAARMVDPDFKTPKGEPIKPTMFLCGNDDAAKKTVVGILDQFGWETADMGLAIAARAIEPLCILWCIPGFRQNHWTHAFKLLY